MGLLVSFLDCILNCSGSQMQDGIVIKHGCWNYLNVVLFDYSLNIWSKWIFITGSVFAVWGSNLFQDGKSTVHGRTFIKKNIFHLFFLDLFEIKWEDFFGQLLNETFSLIPGLYIKSFWFSNARWNRY